MKTIIFKGEKLTLKIGTYYAGNNPSIQLFDEEQSPYMTASVNLPDVKLKKGEVAIKNWSENRGILEALVKQKVVSKPIRYERSGFVEVPICKLLVK